MRANFIISEVLNGLRRNATMTIAMIITTAITLGMFGGGLLVIQMADKSQKIFLDRVEMEFYLNPEVTERDPQCEADPCAQLRRGLENEPGVTSVTYLDKDEAYKRAKEIFANNPDLAENIVEGTLPASLRVRVSDPGQFDAVLTEYAGRKDLGIDAFKDDRKLVQRIFSVLDGVRNATFAIASVLAIAAILLIINTVQIAAFTRRTEVSIMRLVGATRWYTQLPFLLEAVVSALAGSLLAIGGLLLAKKFFFDTALKELYGVSFFARIELTDVLFVAPWLILGGIVLAGATAYVTLRVYVRE
ncbi:permease-like cell division protein FtsX [Gordonia rubripertincta]|uniref:Cell division protein FtsX n=2 Tax=Gordonia rubripertincta TaxID=36822 RepID=A0AAW6R272_GORRU|nr:MULTISPECIES: permease-like cell division protein FtsX [Gordonia]ASR04367.1 Cell division protein FtsX [Gordonia rubripertincta]MBM7278615.1 ABC transporter permease [Gordonia rubripertincta]MDG6779227.1 permease-like cell division protein FtsX [Gordonia rubripertincta]NKY62538.1 ABC transporter permease [Gordonia rubripertincta]QMU23006.1 ABC transporter permease [Gordonia rubripertincta]